MDRDPDPVLLGRGLQAINQVHVAFGADSEAMVEAFYDAALSAGGKDNGPPGPRKGVPGYFGAFVLDPDGNNIEAAYRDPDAVPGE